MLASSAASTFTSTMPVSERISLDIPSLFASGRHLKKQV
jgi:hypothetical protein